MRIEGNMSRTASKMECIDLKAVQFVVENMDIDGRMDAGRMDAWIDGRMGVAVQCMVVWFPTMR